MLYFGLKTHKAGVNMIGRLNGKLVEKQPPQIVIDVGGVGYEVDVSMPDFLHPAAFGLSLCSFSPN